MMSDMFKVYWIVNVIVIDFDVYLGYQVIVLVVFVKFGVCFIVCGEVEMFEGEVWYRCVIIEFLLVEVVCVCYYFDEYCKVCDVCVNVCVVDIVLIEVIS